MKEYKNYTNELQFLDSIIYDIRKEIDKAVSLEQRKNLVSIAVKLKRLVIIKLIANI